MNSNMDFSYSYDPSKSESLGILEYLQAELDRLCALLMFLNISYKRVCLFEGGGHLMSCSDLEQNKGRPWDLHRVEVYDPVTGECAWDVIANPHYSTLEYYDKAMRERSGDPLYFDDAAGVIQFRMTSAAMSSPFE